MLVCIIFPTEKNSKLAILVQVNTIDMLYHYQIAPAPSSGDVSPIGLMPIDHQVGK